MQAQPLKTTLRIPLKGLFTPKNSKYYPIYIGLAVLIISFISFPGNRSENDDGYFYAFQLREYDFEQLFHSKFVLFLPVIKSLYLLSQQLSFFDIDAYLFMCSLNSIFNAAFISIFFYILFKVFNLSLYASLISTAFLMFSYGNWRYAVEADIYPLTNLLTALTLLMILRLLKSTNKIDYRVAFIGILAGIAVLFYKPSIIALFVCFPFLFFFKKRFLTGFIYGLVGGATILSGYYLAFLIGSTNHIGFEEYLFGASEKFSSGSVILAMFVLATRILSANFIYGFEFVNDYIRKSFLGYMIEEEVFTANLSPTLNLLALITSILFLILAITIIFRVVSGKTKPRIDWFVKTVIIWSALCSIAILYLDAMAQEVWNMLILPISFLFAYFVVEPYLQQRKAALLSFFILTLFLHNIFAGFGLIYSRKGDHTIYMSDWVIKNAKEEDIVLSLGSSNLLYYMAYQSEATVYSLEQDFETGFQHLQYTTPTKGKVYLTADVLNPSITIKNRNPEVYQEVTKFVDENKKNILLANTSRETAKVYEFTRDTRVNVRFQNTDE